MKVPGKKAEQQPLPDEGAHVARCIQIIDMGTQTPKDPKYKPSRQIKFVFELIDTNHVFRDGEPPMPFVVSTWGYTFSKGSKKLREFLKNWLGKTITDDMFDSLDLSKFLGYGCNLIVEHYVSATNGLKYSRMVSLSPLPKNTALKKLRNPKVLFCMIPGEPCIIGMPGQADEKPADIFKAYELMYPNNKQDISNSPEWAEISSGAPKTASATTAEGNDGEIEEQDAPF